MSPEDVQRVAAALSEILNERRSVEETEHAEHHLFIREQIERERERREMYADLRRHLVKWGAVGVISFFGMAAWYWVRNHI